MNDIPIGLLVDMMIASEKAETLEITDEGDEIRVKGIFSVDANREGK